MTPQFVAVGGGEMALANVQAVGTDEAPASDNVSLSTVDEYGGPIATYTWNDWAAAAPCWVDDSYEPVEGVSIVPGQAFWSNGSDSAQSIQSAGEVGLKDVVVGLRFGSTLTGNPFPVAIALQDIVAASDDGDASDNVAISTIDEYGGPVATYTWNDWAAAEACWVDDSYEPVTGVTIGAGEGLWTSASSSAQTIRFVAPEL